MNVTVNVKELLQELELLEKVVSKKPSMPVLAHILVQADATAGSQGLRLAATDLEIGLITFCPAIVSVEGTCTLPVKHLLDVVRLLPESQVQLVLESGSVGVRSGSYRSRVQTFPASSFPVMPNMAGLNTLTIPSQAFLEGIRRVRFAIPDSSKSKRYALDGALVTFHQDHFLLAATDTHRLATTKMDAPIKGDGTPIIVPRKTLDGLVAMFATSVDAMVYAAGPNQLFFVVDGRLMFSRVLDGKFPDYSRIIPKENDRHISLARNTVQDAVQRVVLTASEVVFTLSEDGLAVAATAADLGEVNEVIPVEYTGPKFSFKINGQYLLDFLSVATESTFTLSWKNASSSLLLSDKTGYAYVLMPIR